MTTSVGRLFDAAAALLGFAGEVSYEGQAAVWLEQSGRNIPAADAYPFPFQDHELDFSPLLKSIANDRLRGRNLAEISRAFHRGVAQGLCDALAQLCPAYGTDTVVLAGGVFQNELLLQDVKALLLATPLKVYTNSIVPTNDGASVWVKRRSPGLDNLVRQPWRPEIRWTRQPREAMLSLQSVPPKES